MYLKKLGFVLNEVLHRQKMKMGTMVGDKPYFSLEAFKQLIKDLEIEDQVDDLQLGRWYNCSLSIRKCIGALFMKII